MLKKCMKRAFVILMCVSFFIVNPHFIFFGAFYSYALPSSVSVKGTSVNIRSGPGTAYTLLGTVPLGYKIAPLDTVSDSSGNGKTWYRFIYNNQSAYIRSDFTKEMSVYSYDATFEADLNMKGFPESYKDALRDLHANYPNWIFTLHRTGLDFSYVVDNELIGTRTLVNATSISSFKSTDEGKYDYKTSKWPTFDGNAWVAASRAVTAAYLDPRNFLYVPYIFQFEHQTFNPNIHTLAGILEMVKDTFLDSRVETDGLGGAANNTINNYIIPNIGDPGAITNPDAVNSPIPSGAPNIIYPNGIENLPYDTSAPVVPILMNDKQNDTRVTGFSSVYVPSDVGSLENLGPAAGLPGRALSGQSQIIDTTGEIIDEAESFSYTYLPKGSYTYAELIYDACRQVNINPYVVVSMILQEQGKNGSDSVSGKNAKFPSAYNYGNINAFAGGGLTPIENGLKYALTEGSYNRPWNTKEKGIYGLCDFYANSYVRGGQDTFYLKKWNVQGQNPFKHQYMTNVAGAAAEGQLLGNAYDEVLMKLPHEFKIPYYTGMSETRYEVPTGDGSPNNRLKSLNVANYVLTPTFDPNVSDYSIIVDSNVDSVFVTAEAYDNKAAIGGIGNILTATSYTTVIIYCVAENRDIRQYNIHIYKKGAEGVQTANIDNSSATPIIFPNITENQFNNIQNNNSSVNIENYNEGPVIPNILNGNVQIGVAPGQ